MHSAVFILVVINSLDTVFLYPKLSIFGQSARKIYSAYQTKKCVPFWQYK